MVFADYANFYDVYYANKEYAAEAAFVLQLANRFGAQPSTLLDMGCGTGRHLAEFLKCGLTCDGFDLSDQMLHQAEERLHGHNVGLCQGNLTTYENGKHYDIVVSMFAVMGYLVENQDVLAGLQTARKHLAPKGVFIFDGWFGPAVLNQKPEIRCHTYQHGDTTIVRTATPQLDPVRQSVMVKYKIHTEQHGAVLHQTSEEHIMRLMFVQEMRYALWLSGLELLWYGPFMMPETPLTTETWNVSFVAGQKKTH